MFSSNWQSKSIHAMLITCKYMPPCKKLDCDARLGDVICIIAHMN
jgi:hypothetical protein